MSRTSYELSRVRVEATDEYRAPGSSWDAPPDPTVLAQVKVAPSGFGSGGPGGASSNGVEVLARDTGAIEVLGFVSMTECQRQVDKAVATTQASAPPPEKVLPNGYTRSVDATGKVRLNVPGGRWVEFDPTAGTFLVGQ